jgi:hypothetical protein
MSLSMQLERQRYKQGEIVRGFVDVVEAIDARELAVALHYVESTDDYRGVGRVGATSTLHVGPVGEGSRFGFELALPPDALPAFRTRHSALWWEVVASADKPGFDKHARLPIELVPDGPPPPGWHPDPWGQAAQRYWDGTAWTGHTA